MYMYLIYVRRSLAAVGCRFRGYINPTRSSGIRTVSVNVNSNESTGPLFQFWSIQRLTKKTAY